MKYLVTGATSGLGRNAVEALLAQGCNVRATGRDENVGAELTALGAQFVPLELAQADDARCDALMQGCDMVWHCAAKSSPWGSAQAFHAVNVAATERLAHAAARAGVTRFIHISTPAIYFDFRHHHNVDEAYRADRFACHYASSKYAAEQVIQAAARQFTHVTFIILRPRGLFGAHDRVIIPRLLRQLEADHGVLRLPRGGEALLDLTWVGNVVHAMRLATDTPGLISGETFNITNHEPQRLVEMLGSLLGDELQLRYRVASVPWPLLSLVAQGMEIHGHLTGTEPRLTRYSAGTVSFDMTLSQQKAITRLGYRPPVSLAQGVRLTGAWLRERRG
ncbi:SDR family NAD(P)-dependent oxidoreductase [Cronobacter sakazakii]|uniref:NAD-dependent epimerase/dehydratase family protein n=1 Tax=Cronobacter sakazakii TaxID=28141 RepID=UPI000CF16716|nr:SDR family NAD(P)-dependent oxidoreductase [Cronobacter sakazakii]EGT5183141.1 SDR family NAD(P)-dependent oxidoreductase [Cronobacter sakazakii]EGT5764273.1 SDR family NAD(P)-dependent oxidoreductase [Cronobacter sakazakii]EJG0740943.1 SDR family NAD(P)-dependent oxidoreductase [Cronobacter sakazakii]EJG0745104.1 SDR family NAD(P)-dependent oxidoreductase [Cronobacter sakazakii]ELY2534365.1 SDR family NAD(P)-dependent oxidoreductase [Cronobacter sakazakii]